MEVVRWGLPVYFGPCMQDFTDAADMVVPVGAGFKVADADALADLLVRHLRNRELYKQACQAARKLSEQQCGAVREQTEIIRRWLGG
jgi:3-deoxy-D-manno-octulosonic-acid transferase